METDAYWDRVVVDFSTWALDYAFKYRGFSLQAEYWFRNINRHNKGLPCLQTAVRRAALVPPLPRTLGNSTGWYVQSGYYLDPAQSEVAARYSWWDPDTHSGSDLIKEVDVSSQLVSQSAPMTTRSCFTYTNIAMGQGGFAIGRSSPLPSTAGPKYCSCPATFPSGIVPLDAHAGTLIENTIRIQYQFFF